MIRTEHRGPEPAHALEVATGLVPVFQLVREQCEVVPQRQHDRMLVAAGELARGHRLLEYGPRLGQLAELAV
jgi:hypothetical protein